MNALLQNPLLSAFGWALLHFLWEGALLGLLAWFSLYLARRRSPELRYVLACASLALMVFTFLLTAGLQLHSGRVESLGAWFSVTVDGALSWTIGNGSGLRQSLQAWLPAVLLSWALGASFMLLRLGSGFLWLYGPCMRDAAPVDPLWQQSLDRLSEDMGLPRRPRLLSSNIVDSPLVLGWLRPAILVPAAAFAGLGPELLEAVLVHELAHIRRWDFLANLFQSLAEVLFFFHPAVWWISRQIRREREHCCDDAAVRRCGDRLTYASALAALEALRIPTLHSIRLAPAAKGGSIMLRIRRILAPESLVTSHASTLPMVSLLAIVLGLSLCVTQLHAQPAAPAKAPGTRTWKMPEGNPVKVEFSKVKVKYQPPSPSYPEEAKARHIQDVVVVEVIIGKDGVPISAQAIKGDGLLRTTAEDFAMAWTFEPTMVKGKAVEARFVLNMPFKLR